MNFDQEAIKEFDQKMKASYRAKSYLEKLTKRNVIDEDIEALEFNEVYIRTGIPKKFFRDSNYINDGLAKGFGKKIANAERDYILKEIVNYESDKGIEKSSISGYEEKEFISEIFGVSNPTHIFVPVIKEIHHGIYGTIDEMSNKELFTKEGTIFPIPPYPKVVWVSKDKLDNIVVVNKEEIFSYHKTCRALDKPKLDGELLDFNDEDEVFCSYYGSECREKDKLDFLIKSVFYLEILGNNSAKIIDISQVEEN